MELKNFDPNGVGVDNGAFFGLPFTPEQAALVLISAPWDVTVSYGAGAALAPDALIGASTQLDLYDAAAPGAWRAGIATAEIDPAIEECSARLRADARKVIDHLEGGGSQQDDYVVRKIRRVNDGSREFNDLIRTQAARWLGEGKTVGLIGGDHSTPYGLIAALADCNPGFGVLHVDAHCDLRDAYEGFEFSHASIMHNVLRDFPQVSRLVQVGVRDYCDAEAERARTDPRIALFDDRTLREAVFDGRSWLSQCARIVDALPPLVYVSFDVDGLTIEHCPHTGTPVPGGLTFDEAACLLECVVRSGRRIIGFDLVEVVPSDDDRTDVIVGARMLYKLCGLTLKSNAR